MPLRRDMLALAAITGFAALTGVWMLTAPDADGGPRNGPAPVWTETAWPFPLDLFGRGKAFHCSRADCGADIRLYIRPKIGFCDCATGVADDDDLDRMGDLRLVAETTTPLLPGRPVAVGPLRGRSRIYELGPRPPGGRAAISIAVNDRCDMIVATAVLPDRGAENFEPQVIAFLNSEPMLRWVEVTLGL